MTLDRATPETRRRMQSVRVRDTAAELRIRQELFCRGLRYRVDYSVPGTSSRRRVDIAFTRVRVAVFIDGCFWHSCPEHGTLPKSNTAWWAAKLESVVTRDRDSDQLLGRVGWSPFRFWEHEATAPVADSIEAAVVAARESV